MKEKKKVKNQLTCTSFVEQRKKIYRSSTLYSFDGSFYLLHVEKRIFCLQKYLQQIKNSVCSWLSYLALKYSTYPMKNRSLLAKNLALFYKDTVNKREIKTETKIQTDRKFGKNQLKKLNKNTMRTCLQFTCSPS